ncbi:hypothetical protein [Geofilum rubicundum]|nr:hypothetical protein [Geofilum rubicundum]
MRKKALFGMIPLLLLACFPTLNAQQTWAKTGSFTTFTDVGEPGIKGQASYREPDQKYRISGSGENIWYGRDSFSLLSKK